MTDQMWVIGDHEIKCPCGAELCPHHRGHVDECGCRVFGKTPGEKSILQRLYMSKRPQHPQLN